MKKYIICVFIICIITFLGCNSNDDNKVPETEPGMIGYAMAFEQGRILVIDPIAKDFSSTGGVDEFYNAIWFSNIPEDIKTGDKVKVWFDMVAESYPGQSAAIYLEVIPSTKPDGADLNESDAINKALLSEKIDSIWATVVKSIEYKHETDVWKIELKEILGDKIYNIEIKDMQ